MKQETTRRPLIRKVIASKNTENDMTELDENENITIANNNMKKVTSTSVEGDNVFPSFESISKNKFKTSFTQTKTGRQHIAEKLLKVALNTKNQIKSNPTMTEWTLISASMASVVVHVLVLFVCVVTSVCVKLVLNLFLEILSKG